MNENLYNFKQKNVEVRDLISFFSEHKIFCIALLFLLILILCAVFAPYIAPEDPSKINLAQKNIMPSSDHILGTDYLGRDVLSRLIYGANTSLSIAFITVLVSAFIGISAGLIAGYYGGIIDELISRAIDTFIPFPGMIIALAIVAFLPQGIFAIVLALTLHSWAGFARIVRNGTYSVKSREFILAAKLSGITNFQIIKKHIFPNVFAPVLILMTLDVGGVILSIAGLSYLGLGIPTDIPEWGAMISNGKEFIRSAPLLTIIPGIIVTGVVLLFNILGEELRAILNPVKEGFNDL